MKRKVSSFTWLVVGLIVAVVVAMTGATGLYAHVFHGGLSSDHLAWGSFGGYIGGVLGPLFSLFALIAVLYTLYRQKKEAVSARKRQNKEAHVREFLSALEVIEGRMARNRETVDGFLKNQHLTKEVIERYPNWHEMKACFVYMSFCMRQLNSTAFGNATSDFYQILYKDIVEKLTNLGALPKAVFEPFFAPSDYE
jgi:uncharacterized membrane protein